MAVRRCEEREGCRTRASQLDDLSLFLRKPLFRAADISVNHRSSESDQLLQRSPVVDRRPDCEDIAAHSGRVRLTERE